MPGKAIYGYFRKYSRVYRVDRTGIGYRDKDTIYNGTYTLEGGKG